METCSCCLSWQEIISLHSCQETRSAVKGSCLKNDRLLQCFEGVYDLQTCVNRSLHSPPGSIVSLAVGLDPRGPGPPFQEMFSQPWLPGHVTFLLSYLPELLAITAWLLHPHSLQLLAPWTQQAGPSPGSIRAQVYRRETCPRKWVRNDV